MDIVKDLNVITANNSITTQNRGFQESEKTIKLRM